MNTRDAPITPGIADRIFENLIKWNLLCTLFPGVHLDKRRGKEKKRERENDDLDYAYPHTTQNHSPTKYWWIIITTNVANKPPRN